MPPTSISRGYKEVAKRLSKGFSASDTATMDIELGLIRGEFDSKVRFIPKTNYMLRAYITKMGDGNTHNSMELHFIDDNSNVIVYKRSALNQIDMNGKISPGGLGDFRSLERRATFDTIKLNMEEDGTYTLITQDKIPASKSRFGLGAHLITVAGIAALGYAGAMYGKNANIDRPEKI